jgi:hypothetical protein
MSKKQAAYIIALAKLFEWAKNNRRRTALLKYSIQHHHGLSSKAASKLYKKMQHDAHGILNPEVSNLPEAIVDIIGDFSEDNEAAIKSNPGIKFVVSIIEGSPEVETRKVFTLSNVEIKQVYTTRGNVRSVEEQVAWLTSKTKKPEGYVSERTVLQFHGNKDWKALCSSLSALLRAEDDPEVLEDYLAQLDDVRGALNNKLAEQLNPTE